MKKKVKILYLAKKKKKERDERRLISSLLTKRWMVGKPPNHEEDESRALNIDDIIEMEVNANENSGRPKKRKKK